MKKIIFFIVFISLLGANSVIATTAERERCERDARSYYNSKIQSCYFYQGSAVAACISGWSSALTRALSDCKTIPLDAENPSYDNNSALYRFWSDQFNGHFYTTSHSERDNIIANDPNWRYEGQLGKTADSSDPEARPVYRFWSDTFKHHFYTISPTEARNDPNWRYETIAYYAYPAYHSGAENVDRFWSDNFKGHFYTSSQSETINLIRNDENWRYEGVAWYLPN